MKKQINLFKTKKEELRTPFLILQLKKAGLVASIIAFILILTTHFFLYRVNKQKADLFKEEAQLSSYITSSTQFQNEVSVFVDRKELLKKYLTEDAQFLPYYGLLNNLIESVPQVPKIVSITMDNAQKSQIIFSVPNYDSLYNLLTLIESEAFLKHFITLSINPFHIVSNNTGDTEKEGFELKVDAKFKPIYEKNP